MWFSCDPCGDHDGREIEKLLLQVCYGADISVPLRCLRRYSAAYGKTYLRLLYFTRDSVVDARRGPLVHSNHRKRMHILQSGDARGIANHLLLLSFCMGVAFLVVHTVEERKAADFVHLPLYHGSKGCCLCSELLIRRGILLLCYYCSGWHVAGDATSF